VNRTTPVRVGVGQVLRVIAWLRPSTLVERGDLHYLVFECLGQRATSRAGAVDPCMASAAIGDSAPGTTGVLMLTRDSGDTWQRVDMPVEPDSAMWVVRQRPDTPNLVLAASRYGYLYRSDDRGQS